MLGPGYRRPVRARVLGPMEVLVADRPVELGGLKQRTVLALLLAARGRTVSVDRLVDEIWGEDPPAKVLTSVQSYVANLRRALEPDRDPRTPPRVLVTRAPGYALVLPPGGLDADGFVAAAERGRRAAASDPGAALAELDPALALWRGDAYAETAGVAPSLAAEAARLTELRLLAREARWHALLELGAAAEAVGELQEFVREHPLREGGWALLALALYRAERQAEALDALRRARALLAEELGLDPGARLRELEQAILRHDVAPLRPAAPVAGAEPPAPTPVAREEDALVGRDAEVLALAAALDRARQGAGQVILVSGEAGIGKSRLVRAAVTAARERGLRVGVGRWEEDEGAPPLWAWREALGDDGSALAPGPAGLDGVGDVEASTHALAEAVLARLRARPSLLVLEDAHWGDRDGLRLLGRVAARVSGVPAALIVTFRDTGPVENEALAAVLAALAVPTDVRLTLTGLDEDGVRELCTATSGVSVAPAVARALRERTGGNPFYVAELVRLLARGKELRDPQVVTALEVPHGVRDVVRRRLARLPSTAAVLLTTASAVGRVFDLDVVEAASGLGQQDAAAALEALLLTGLLEEETPSRYRFPHALAREAVYGQASGPRRARLHGAVAAALRRCRAATLEARSEEMALHLSLAGPRHAGEARTWALTASRRARTTGAFHESLRWAATAADLLDADPAAGWADGHEVAVVLVQARMAVGQVLEAAAGAARAGAAALDHGEPEAAAEVMLQLSAGPWHWREYGSADLATIALLRRVLAALPAADVLRTAQVTAFLAAELSYPEQDESVALAREALRLVQNRDDGELWELLTSVHTALQRNHQLAERLAVVDRLEAVARRSGDEARLALALTFRCGALYESGDWDRAARAHAQARRIATEWHLVQVLVVLGYTDVAVALGEGRLEDAARLLDAAQELHRTTSIIGAEYIRIAQGGTLLLLRNRLADLEPELRAFVDVPPFRDLHALALVQGGDVAAARRSLGPWERQPALARDYLWLPLTGIRALVWAELGDPVAVAALRAELDPFRDRPLWGGTGVFMLGPTSGVLAVLAAAGRDADAAAGYAGQARQDVDAHGWRGLPPAVRRVLDLLPAAAEQG